MDKEYQENLSKEFNLEEIERKLNSTSTVETDTVKASDFFLLAKFQMKFGKL